MYESLNLSQVNLEYASSFGFVISQNKIALYALKGIFFYDLETNECYQDKSYDQDDCVATLIRSPCELPVVWLIKNDKTLATRVYNATMTKIIWEDKEGIVPSAIYHTGHYWRALSIKKHVWSSSIYIDNIAYRKFGEMENYFSMLIQLENNKFIACHRFMGKTFEQFDTLCKFEFLKMIYPENVS